MLDLFDTPPIPGFAAEPALLSAPEERTLIGRIDALDLTPFQFQQWQGKRLTHSFGWHYDFQTGAISTADPIPDWLMEVRAAAAAFAGLTPADLVQVLLTRYDPGAGIGWHRDRLIYEHVVGISLGAPADMRFRKRTDRGWRRVTVPLAPRGSYRLSGEARHAWEHSILPMQERRYSITMRSFADRAPPPCA
ncbi:alpha-ketoglutarate-dependent dioxygenase AlkB [Sphingomonas sp. BAUL-RG-20F-R05-02]|uniref:alpha-ketoglutarate-dependent dioxygenase AlkB n=1 Tax=Sphingomonas sp. BAUL-RG-20F-R05-02 TaxID=2914830 RepID=UPI001F59F740|nr:alpha-ketoglutarate-dependent dioxygenase AlkB [Sphingomonas sp. BAUL-RG-20F-R05-02]